jgi:hypothetical protein
VFTERCVLMEGVGVCDVTRETAEYQGPVLPVDPSMSQYFDYNHMNLACTHNFELNFCGVFRGSDTCQACIQ